MVKIEKMYLIGMIVLIVLLLLKSFVFDPYSPKNEGEEQFYTYIDKIVEDKYSDGVYAWLVHVKIVNISELKTRDRAYKNLNGDTQLTDGTYKAKIRKYILGVLPFSEESIIEGVPDES